MEQIIVKNEKYKGMSSCMPEYVSLKENTIILHHKPQDQSV